MFTFSCKAVSPWSLRYPVSGDKHASGPSWCACSLKDSASNRREDHFPKAQIFMNEWSQIRTDSSNCPSQCFPWLSTAPFWARVAEATTKTVREATDRKGTHRRNVCAAHGKLQKSSKTLDFTLKTPWAFLRILSGGMIRLGLEGDTSAWFLF